MREREYIYTQSCEMVSCARLAFDEIELEKKESDPSTLPQLQLILKLQNYFQIICQRSSTCMHV